MLNVAIFTLTMRSTFTLHSKTEKISKSGILEMLPSWYILSLSPKGKGDCKNLIHFSLVSCLSIFLIQLMNLDHIYFFNRLNYNFTGRMTITFEMAIKKCVKIFRLFHFTKVLTKHSLKGQFVLHIAFHN